MKCFTGVVAQFTLWCGKRYVDQTGRRENEWPLEHEPLLKGEHGAHLLTHGSSHKRMSCLNKIQILGGSRDTGVRELLVVICMKVRSS